MRVRSNVLLGAVLLLLVGGAGVFLLFRSPEPGRAPVSDPGARPAEPGPALVPCTLPDLPAAVECGTLPVFEDRAAGTGRRIALNIVRFPARNGSPGAEPLFLIAGGPGAAASAMAPIVPIRFGRIWQDRDIVLVDQRGTGGSNRLDCELFPTVSSYFGELFPPAMVEDCRDRLSARADLRLYTTPIAVDDLNDVRAALGYGRIHLYGSSYGTAAALAYLRRHPETVRTVTLESVVPLDENPLLQFAAAGRRALELLFARCAVDAECRHAYPDLARDFRAVLGRLEDAPARAVVRDPATGGPVAVSLGRDAFVTGLQLALFDPRAFDEIPGVIAAAARGEFGPAAETVIAGRGLYEHVSIGMHLSVRCSEDAPGIALAAADPAAAAGFVGDAWLRAYRQACAVWPRGTLPPGYHRPVASDVPALLLSGELDPATPPATGDRVARHLSNARHVVLAGASHWSGEAAGCAAALIASFVAAGTVEGLDTDCAGSSH